MFQEEEIFEDYYTGKPYFRLKQAYLAYVSHLYIVKNRVLTERIIRIMMKEFMAKEYLADICKLAILKFCAGKEVGTEVNHMLKGFLYEMSEKHMAFPFYLEYPNYFLREIQLHDKVMVEYCSEFGGKVKIHYNIMSDAGESGYQTENLLPMYDKVYVKDFVLFEGERVSYYFEEQLDGEQILSEKEICLPKDLKNVDGKFGRLNRMSSMTDEEQYEEMLYYKKEEHVAENLFKTY